MNFLVLLLLLLWGGGVSENPEEEKCIPVERMKLEAIDFDLPSGNLWTTDLYELFTFIPSKTNPCAYNLDFTNTLNDLFNIKDSNKDRLREIYEYMKTNGFSEYRLPSRSELLELLNNSTKTIEETDEYIIIYLSKNSAKITIKTEKGISYDLDKSILIPTSETLSNDIVCYDLTTNSFINHYKYDILKHVLFVKH